jgi:hypothetical protein
VLAFRAFRAWAGPASLTACVSPSGPGQRVLDLPMLGALDDVGALVGEGAHKCEAALLHHTPGSSVDGHRVREYALDTEAGKAHADQGTRSFGGIALVPGIPAQPVAEVNIFDVLARAGPQMEPAGELPAGAGLGSPGSEPVELIIEGKVEGDDLVLDLLARRRLAAGEVALAGPSTAFWADNSQGEDRAAESGWAQ